MSRTKRCKNHYPDTRETYAVGEWVCYTVYYPLQPRNHYYPSGYGKCDFVPMERNYQPTAIRRKWVIIDPQDRKRYGRARAKRHKESSTGNERTPGHIFRKNREHEYRQTTKCEIHRYLMNSEYEIVLHDKPKSHMWDWR